MPKPSKLDISKLSTASDGVGTVDEENQREAWTLGAGAATEL